MTLFFGYSKELLWDGSFKYQYHIFWLRNKKYLSKFLLCIQQVGTNLVNVNLRRHELTVRELGGCMGPIWKNYFKNSSAIMVINPLTFVYLMNSSFWVDTIN